MNETEKKFEELKHYLTSLGAVAIAFSGGVDSTFLLKTAFDVLGENCVAITVRSSSFPERELKEAKEFCEKYGIKQVIVDFDEMKVKGFAQNPPDRCYICKTALFEKMRAAAEKLGIKDIAEGSNVDDDGDYRPGLAAVKEQGIKSPLRYARLNKAEIRELSEKMGLPTWNKPSFACLASRFVYGETITKEKLKMVGKAEQFLLELGFTQVRVRIHGLIARIEIKPEEFSKLIACAPQVNKTLKSLGFTYVSMDLGGYRTGSMNEIL